MLRMAAWRYVIAGGTALMVVYFACPAGVAQDGLYSFFGLASVGCMVAGIRLHRPSNVAAWWAMAGSNLCFVLGDAVLSYYDVVRHHSAPFPSLADALYLPGYPFLFFAVSRLTRRPGRSGAREDRADAAIVAVAATALCWHLLMSSYAHDSSMSAFGRLVTMSYPILDLGVLFIVLSRVLFAGARRPVDTLVVAAIGSMMFADIAYDLLTLHGLYESGNIIDSGWLLSYTLLGAAALHPSMATALDADPVRPSTRRRLPRVAIAGFVIPAILLVSGVTRSQIDLVALAACSAVLFGLVILRVVWVLNRLNDQTVELSAALAAQQSLQQDLRYAAFHDALTGLANRALLQERVEHGLQMARRSSGTMALLFCDLDGFKTINDSLGHQAGDDLLVAVGKRLCSVVREGDTVARLGGDEFAILMESVDDPDVTMAVAERVVEVLRRPIDLDGRPIVVSVSVGVAFADSGQDAEAIFSEADAAMYASKAAGKDQVACFEQEMRTRVLHQMELRNSFTRGLDAGEFYVEYQPHLGLADGHIEGFEALVRWQHPSLGLISPADFIPLAEETGFIVPLGRWVLATACAAAATWTRTVGRRLSVSVNVSTRQLRDAQLVEDVRDALAATGFAADQLVVEVTETMLMQNPAQAAAVLSELRALGVRVAIDDFGTGYSSLSHLREFPIDLLKIDRSFVSPLSDPSNEGAAFVASIIRLAHDLALTTVAEGIENAAQHQALIDLGCDSAQGFLLSRPLGAEAALAFAERAVEREGRSRRGPRSPVTAHPTERPTPAVSRSAPA
ncbi:MAG TPA: EAL domain-containing protein [Jatrophihabitans sp.]|uniref:putative bifunctional diguanylate cyclase/phosphodiesterase n=1 Tax=Jatrophihabitans sp. TaxID=1932789 RepID=UPI002E07A79A|nr:EAL domain-containing protein [Jatrophihabitans sp.]